MSQSDYHLIGTHTRYSSWTARVETILEYFKIPYTKEFVSLDQARTRSPSAQFPLLQCHSLGITINGSLSIVEFLADQNPHLHLWPSDPALRAVARSATTEMHSGFVTMRSTFHTNFIVRYTGNIPVSENAKREIKRILTIWDNARRVTNERVAQDQDEGFLFGKFSIADAWFWPVLWRFRTYNLPLDNVTPKALEWMEKIWGDPQIKRLVYGYYRQAEDPRTRIEKYEGLFADEGVVYETFPEDWVALLASDGFLAAYDADTHVPDNYARSSQAENVAQNTVVAVYDKNVPGGFPGVQEQYTAILNQYSYIQDKAGDALLPGGTCDRHLENSETVVLSSSAANTTVSRARRGVAARWKVPQSGFKGEYSNIVKEFVPFRFKEEF